jgi:hypothetical protein
MNHRAGMGLVVIAVVCGLLASCDKAPPPAPAPAPAVMIAPGTLAGVDRTGNADRRMAYSHAFSVELPNDAVAPFQQKNLADCLAAGCTVLNTQLRDLSRGTALTGPMVFGSISVRIAPDHLVGFVASISAPPARLTNHTEQAEDQTAPLLDLDKRLEAQTTLRDRLTLMLKQQGTSVADLIAIEKQLADVQGTIESATAQRDYLRTITDTIRVDVSYSGITARTGSIDYVPLREALDGFARAIIISLGQLILFIAVILPWLPVVALVYWVVRRLWRRRGRAARPVPAPVTPPDKAPG